MPNFQTKSLKNLAFPHKADKASFLWMAKVKNEDLIFTRYEDEVFFIKQINRDKNILIKGDKLAKPSMVKILQNALIEYEKATESKAVFSNIHSRKNRQEKKSEILKNVDFFALKFNTFKDKFENTRVEVGFGSGRHLLYQAKQNPKDLYIGIEIHKPSIEQVIKQCDLQNIKNIIIIDMDARVLMEFFASNSIDRIFVHFPVPWDKKPHRRVISKAFLNQALRVLKKNSSLELRTDSDNYFNYSLEQMLSFKHIDMQIKKNQDIAITSKYEARWKKQQKDIYDIYFTNKDNSESKELPKELTFDFEVKNDNFKKETILQDGWFVNFEKNYRVDGGGFVQKIALGDTANVEHCYLVVQDKKASYFPRKLYSTKNNLNAHKLISERLKS